MDSRTSPAPPAAARPKNSASSISSSHPPNSSPQSASMASSSKPARGSTPTAGRSSAKVADPDKPARAASKDSLKPKLVKKPDDHPRPSKSDEQLKVLKTEFDSLRSHLTCKICDRLLYQPYTISCGHTYCYTCLCTWFGANKSHKTCPDCRIVVSQLPAPAYVIRDMTNVFISRAELLPPGETVDEHKKWQKDEADAVQQDKDNTDSRTGGIFKGSFRPQARHSIQVIRDREDGVERCPMCQWELEDGECVRCGLFFDDNGELTWGDSFNGFSDMDEMSERDTEDLDHDMDMEEGDFEDYDENMDAWQDYLPDQSSFMMRRFLEANMPGHAAFARRRPMSHSEAGSRRSYSQSIVSDMYTDEMDTVEEEDEDGADGEDSSMNGFIDDEAMESSSSATASSTPGPTTQPSTSQRRTQARARRVVESETSSTISSVVEEDEEDEGPIRRGQRNRAQARLLNRANGPSSSNGPPSSTSTDTSTEELDEDTQALLQSEGWMLQHDGPDDEMGEEEDDDSDGGRTTVGWEPTAISNDRVRMGGSLTPTADRPRPSAPIRPPSRVGTARFMNATRGLRRRSSVLSTSTVHYEDGEADDDDSDQDGDIVMAMNALRSRRSQLQMRNSAGSANHPSRFANRGPSQGDAVDLDTDDNSDSSQSRNNRGTRHYDPRISWMFAAHQRALQEEQMGPLIDIEPRSTTPIARPRTSNRNRPSPAQVFSPFMPPTRLRTPQMDNSSNMAAVSRAPVSPPRRNLLSPTLPVASIDNTIRAEQAPSASSSSNASVVLTPRTSTPTSQTSQQSVDTIAQMQSAAAMDMIDRPLSRVSARPPSAAGRRNSAGISPVYPGFPHTNVGLNIQGRIFPHQALGNPWGAFVQPRVVRNRNSRPVLRDQSSTATLRPANSRANIRDAANPQQGMRQQASRINLRSQPSQRRLNTQSSTRTLRASEHARPPASPLANPPTTQATTRSPRFTPDERDSLARELINNRMRALGQPNAAPVRTNPFAPGFRRPSISNETSTALSAATGTPQHMRNNSNESVNSVVSSGTTQGAPTSPTLRQRRSNRNMAPAPPAGMQPPSQGPYAQPGNAYANNTYFRGRQGSFSGATPPFESSLNSNTRGMSPMMAGPLI